MKKFIYLAGLTLLFSSAFWINGCNEAPDATVAASSSHSKEAMVKRGEYLVTVCSCMHCHAERDFNRFSGPVIAGTEGQGGDEIEPGLYARNITPYGLSGWTDDEIFKVLTTGIRKNGDTLAPIMPYTTYAKMPEEDLYSIIAYLRTLKEVKRDVPARHIEEPMQAAFSEYYRRTFLREAKQKLELPPAGDVIKRGKYLVEIADCAGCHTPFDFEKLDFVEGAYMSGGVLFTSTERDFKVNSANLTPDSATGTGTWTAAAFLSKFKNFRDARSYDFNPGKMNSFMPWTILAKMTDDDILAIYAYLRTVKPVSNKVVKYPD